MVQQVAPLCVGVHGHVSFRAGNRATSCNLAQEGTEPVRVQGVAEGKEVWEESDLFLGEVIERSKVSGLVDLGGSTNIGISGGHRFDQREDKRVGIMPSAFN